MTDALDAGGGNSDLASQAEDAGRDRRDPFEWIVLAGLTGLAFAVLVGLLVRTSVKGGFVTCLLYTSDAADE